MPNSRINLKLYQPLDLLNLFSRVLDRLKDIGVVQTRNNPVSDYAEWLVGKVYNLTIMSPSVKCYDAESKGGRKTRYQIKSRRLTPETKSRQLGVLRNLRPKQFDYLIVVFFDNDFLVSEAYRVPYSIINRCASDKNCREVRFNKHQNGHLIQVKGKIIEDKNTENITKKLQNTQRKSS